MLVLLTENLISKVKSLTVQFLVDVSVFHVNIGRDLQVHNSTDLG